MLILALDYGTARTGCAISDPSGTLSTPLPVIEPSEARSVAELVAKYEVERVVVGLPLHLSGEEGSQAALTRTRGGWQSPRRRAIRSGWGLVGRRGRWR